MAVWLYGINMFCLIINEAGIPQIADVKICRKTIVCATLFKLYPL